LVQASCENLNSIYVQWLIDLHNKSSKFQPSPLWGGWPCVSKVGWGPRSGFCVGYNAHVTASEERAGADAPPLRSAGRSPTAWVQKTNPLSPVP